MVTMTLPVMFTVGDNADVERLGAKRNHQSKAKQACCQCRYPLVPTVDDNGVPIIFWKRQTTTKSGCHHRTVTGSEFVNNFAWAKFNWLYEEPPSLMERDAAVS